MNKPLDTTSLLAKIKNLETKNIVYYCPFLDGEIKVNRLPFEKAVRHFDNFLEAYKSSDLESVFESFIQVAYESCPIFKNEELKQGLENIIEPTDIVKKIYIHNLEALSDLADFIFNQYGLNINTEDNPTEDETVDELKNS